MTENDTVVTSTPNTGEYTKGSMIHDEGGVDQDGLNNEQHLNNDAAPPRFVGLSQVRALVSKNALSKLRIPIGTLFELFSPMLMMLILVAAYSLSEITTEYAQQYDTINFDLPGPWIGLVEQAASLLGGGGIAGGLLSRRNRKLRTTSTSAPEFGLTLLQDLGLKTTLNTRNRRLQEDVPMNGTDDGATTTNNDDVTFGLLDDARQELTTLLANPVPVPTFDQFVTASLGLASVIDADDLPVLLADSSYGRAWGNLLTLGTLHLSPNSGIVDDFQQYLNLTHPAAFDSIRIRTHDDEADAIKYINDNLNERTWGLLDFSDFQNDSFVEYKIRMNYTTLPNTNQIVNLVSVGRDATYERYYLSGYLTLQQTLNQFAMSRLDCNATASQAIWSMPMPTAAYNQNTFFQVVGFLLGLTIAMAFLYPTSRTIKTLVEEKELRLKETLYILGVRPWAHFLSWVLTCVWVYAIIAITVTVALTANILKYSSNAYIFTYIVLFCTSTIGFCFVVASFFSRAKLAAIVGPMALFATLLPRFIFFGSNRFEAITAKRWASLLPCTAFAFGADIIADYEYAEVGVQSWNANSGAYSFSTVLGFLFFDTLLYMFLGWYLELVIPRQYGVARPWYFLFLPRYWLSFFGCAKSAAAQDVVPPHVDAEGDDFEAVTDPSWNPRVVIADLVKRYNKNPDIPPAVNHLNLTLYESQITCLLGHNGAGKTSTISVLTGLFPPTSGDCYIYGNSIVNRTYEARQSMGICPQHNILFDQLTVTEHLSFFQRIKGIKPTRSSLRQSAQEIGLGDYLRTTSIALSGGNKRKLSLAIALCGDPQFLMLDEPTSGMDVASRRNCWELLRKKRQGRVTLLTTHFLDEASLLADRIAVMKEGQLQCVGSELFLKNRFGLGYNLTVVLEGIGSSAPVQSSLANDDEDDVESGSRGTPSPLLASASEEITAFLNQYVPNTELIRKSARELTFRFPQGTEDSFPDVFDALEEERGRLGIGAYGVSDTSLEEIFLQLAETKDGSPEKARNTDDEITESRAHASTAVENKAAPADAINEDHQVSQEDLRPLNLFRQILLLYGKRFTIQRRDLKGAFFQVLLPVLLCALVLLVLTLEIVLAGPPIELSVGLYRTGSDGAASRTDVVVGGGMTIETDAARRLTVLDEEFMDVSSLIQSEYPHAEFEHLIDAVSSSDISQYLLETYNDHQHNDRFGALALYDRINMTAEIDWDALRQDLRSLVTSSLADVTSVDVGSLLGINGSVIDVNTSFPEISSFIEEVSDALGNETFTIDTVALRDATQRALRNTINSAVALNAPNATLLVQDLEDALDEFFDDVNEIGPGETNPAISFVNAVLSTITDGVVQDLGSSTVEQISAALLNRGEIFNRTVIIEGWLEIFDELLNPFGGTRNTSEAIANLVTEAFDAVANSTADLTSAPNDLLILPVILLDGFANQLYENFGENATLSLGQLSTVLIEDVLPVSGNLRIKVDRITIDVAGDAVVLEGVFVELMSEVLLSDETITVGMSTLDSASALLPSGRSSLVVGFNTDVSILHNSSSPHAVAAFNQAFMEYSFKQCTNDPNMARLNSVNHPLPVTEQQAIEIRTILSILASLFLLIPYCYVPGAFIVFLVKERVSKSKHLQLVSGVELTSYWIGNYLWDLTLWLLLTMLIMVVFLIYGGNSAAVFVGDGESFVASMLLTFGYGLSVLPFSYLLSKGFDNHSAAQIAVMGVHFLFGFVAVNAYFILISIESTKAIGEALLPFWRLYPPYNVGEGFIQLSSAYFEREILGSDRKPLDWDVAGKNLAIIYALSVPYFLLLLLLEYADDGGAGGPIGRVLRKLRSAYGKMILRFNGVRKGQDGVSLLLDDGLDNGRSEDDDVVEEQKYVIENKKKLQPTASVLLVNMWKIYPPTVGVIGNALSWIRKIFQFVFCLGCFRKTSAANVEDEESDKSNLPKRAVRGVSTAIMDGETYGLLGVNGAGKTTTMGVLTGDIAPTGGEAYVAGHDVSGNTPGGVASARKHIGYCPQVDPLLDLMTGRETLRMFGRLRGIPDERLDSTVGQLLDRLTLTPHADKASQSYSGGNKRKLSLGVALIGDPRVLFIDEASSGMDPSTRRKTWALIEEAAQTRSVILTSHSMEEVEALCTRVGIMVKGQYLCLGSVQHLKSKYLDGYTIFVQCEGGTPDAEVDDIVATILSETLPGSTLAERHGRFLRFDTSSVGLGATFRKLRELKESTSVVDYSISQCSLEQVFIKLVNSGSAEAIEPTPNDDITTQHPARPLGAESVASNNKSDEHAVK